MFHIRALVFVFYYIPTSVPIPQFPTSQKPNNNTQTRTKLTSHLHCWFQEFRILPEDGLWKTETCRSLHCTYMIFNFLVV